MSDVGHFGIASRFRSHNSSGLHTYLACASREVYNQNQPKYFNIFNTKIKIAPLADKRHILIAILVTFYRASTDFW